MYFFPKTVTPLILAQAESTVRPAALLCHSTTQFVVVSLCCFSLRHDDMKFIAAFFFSLKPLVQSSDKKKSQTKKRSVKRYRAKCIKRQLMENIIKCSYPKMTGQNDQPDESLTGQVHDQAGHCPLTGCYFEPCSHGCNLSCFFFRIFFPTYDFINYYI